MTGVISKQPIRRTPTGSRGFLLLIFSDELAYNPQPEDRLK